MNENPNRRIRREEASDDHLTAFIVALVISFAIHAVLGFFAGDRTISFAGDFLATLDQKLALFTESALKVETFEEDPAAPLPDGDRDITNPYDVEIEDIFLSVPTATPAAVFEPPPAPGELFASQKPELQKPGPAAAAEPTAPWQPREDLVMVVDKIVYDDVVPFAPRVVPDIERKVFTPDVSLEYKLSEAIETAGSIGTPSYVAPAPPKVDDAEVAQTLVGGETRMPEIVEAGSIASGEKAAEFLREIPADVAPDKPIENVLKTGLVVYRPRRSDGYVYFRVDVDRKGADVLPPLPRDILLVQDASASLSIDRLNFCRQAFNDIVDGLPPTDRFNVMKFSTDTSTAFGNGWRRADAAAKAEAKTFIAGIESEGNTDIFNAMHAVLEMPRVSGRVMIVILASDGRATAGDVRRDAEIIGQFSKLNQGGVSVFNVGVSKTSNEFLLSMLSFCNRGGAAAIADDRFMIPGTIKRLFEGISSPVLTDIRFMFDSKSRAEVVPTMLTHLYLDRPMQLFGRAPEGTKSVVFQARGRSGENRYDMIFDLDLTTAASADKDLATAWATAQMYDYVAEHARNPSPALLETMNELGRQYNVTIPFRRRLF
ncbi:MAG: VWA domain-containing protein [Kiritimatiellia bacterium]|jgi:hypothetical protein